MHHLIENHRILELEINLLSSSIIVITAPLLVLSMLISLPVTAAKVKVNVSSPSIFESSIISTVKQVFDVPARIKMLWLRRGT